MIGFSAKNSMKTKFRNRLKTSTIDMLLRCILNFDLINMNDAINHFIANKQNTFTQYVKNKEEYYKEKEIKSNLIMIIIMMQ